MLAETILFIPLAQEHEQTERFKRTMPVGAVQFRWVHLWQRTQRTPPWPPPHPTAGWHSPGALPEQSHIPLCHSSPKSHSEDENGKHSQPTAQLQHHGVNICVDLPLLILLLTDSHLLKVKHQHETQRQRCVCGQLSYFRMGMSSLRTEQIPTRPLPTQPAIFNSGKWFIMRVYLFNDCINVILLQQRSVCRQGQKALSRLALLGGQSLSTTEISIYGRGKHHDPKRHISGRIGVLQKPSPPSSTTTTSSTTERKAASPCPACSTRFVLRSLPEQCQQSDQQHLQTTDTRKRMKYLPCNNAHRGTVFLAEIGAACSIL